MKRDGTLCPLRLEMGNGCVGSGPLLADCENCPDQRRIRLLHLRVSYPTRLGWFAPEHGFLPVEWTEPRCSCGGPWPCEMG